VIAGVEVRVIQLRADCPRKTIIVAGDTSGFIRLLETALIRPRARCLSEASRHSSVGRRSSIKQPVAGLDLIEREFTAPAPVRGVDLIDAAGQTGVEREPAT
jgi:hypothetical protein